jgi:hypothetical protein
MRCKDTGPAYERTPVRESVANNGSPTHGTLSNLMVDSPSTVLYTPNHDSIGTDSMKIIGFDDFGFGDQTDTITIKVFSNHVKIGKLKRKKRTGTAILPVRVPGPGKLVLFGKRVKRNAEHAAQAGKVRLKLKPKGKAKRKLRGHHRARVKANVTYTPTGGKPRTKAKTVRLVKK